jgi:hypothetical protein
LLGQSLAHQVGLGYLYPKNNINQALKSVFRYNWFPELAPYYEKHKQGRNFAEPNEPGLVIVTWPKGKEVEGEFINEVWSGIEYQVASHMLYEGLVPEGLAILRGIHDRYDGRRHNPWNEPEAGEHYARAMASWGCLISASGYTYNGPKGIIGFAPRLKQDNFKSFFTAAEGWGSLIQKRGANSQSNIITVKWGKLVLSELQFELPQGAEPTNVKVTLNDENYQFQEKLQFKKIIQKGSMNKINIYLSNKILIESNKSISVEMFW